MESIELAGAEIMETEEMTALYAAADELGLAYEAGFDDDLLSIRVAQGPCVDGLTRGIEPDGRSYAYPCSGCNACETEA